MTHCCWQAEVAVGADPGPGPWIGRDGDDREIGPCDTGDGMVAGAADRAQSEVDSVSRAPTQFGHDGLLRETAALIQQCQPVDDVFGPRRWHGGERL
jgi:hypothetical protein